MPQLAFKMQLFKGNEEEYKRRHDALWPEIQELLEEAGVYDYSIFLDEPTGILFATFKVSDVRLLDSIPHQPAMKRWWAYMKDIMETNEDNSPVSIPLKKVFHLKRAESKIY